MEYLNKFTGGANNENQAGTVDQTQIQPGQGEQQQQQQGGGGFMSMLSGKANTALGGGEASEKNEDYLDKGIDMFQEKVLGQGPQNNESAAEQFKDEQMSDYLRNAYKTNTGKDFFVADKPT